MACEIPASPRPRQRLPLASVFASMETARSKSPSRHGSGPNHCQHVLLEERAAASEVPAPPKLEVIEALAALGDLPPRVIWLVHRSCHEAARYHGAMKAERAAKRGHVGRSPPDVWGSGNFRPLVAIMRGGPVLLRSPIDVLSKPAESTLTVAAIGVFNARSIKTYVRADRARLRGSTLPESFVCLEIPIFPRVGHIHGRPERFGRGRNHFTRG